METYYVLYIDLDDDIIYKSEFLYKDIAEFYLKSGLTNVKAISLIESRES